MRWCRKKVGGRRGLRDGADHESRSRKKRYRLDADMKKVLQSRQLEKEGTHQKSSPGSKEKKKLILGKSVS